VPGVRAVNSLSIFSQRSDGSWHRHQEQEFLQLKQYQLPELLGVSASSGSGDAEFPSGIEALGDSGNGDGTGVPAPVIPDVC
jgi:hypothetical protein